MKKLFLLAIALMFTSFLHAKTERTEKMMALKVLKKYSETVACSTNFYLENKKPLSYFLKNVFTIQRNNEYGTATYFVWWSGDMECTGGSGANSSYVSKVYRDDSSKPFLVINDDAFEKAFSKINSRFIESITQLDTSHFSVVASKYAKGDANCCPSLKYQFSISKIAQEWVMSSKNPLK